MNAVHSLPFICSWMKQIIKLCQLILLCKAMKVLTRAIFINPYGKVNCYLKQCMLWLCSHELTFWMSILSHPGCQDVMHSSWINNDVDSLGYDRLPGMGVPAPRSVFHLYSWQQWIDQIHGSADGVQSEFFSLVARWSWDTARVARQGQTSIPIDSLMSSLSIT